MVIAATDAELLAIVDALEIIGRSLAVVADVVRDVRARELQSELQEHLVDQTRRDGDDEL